MARPFAVLAALLALAGSAQGHIEFTPSEGARGARNLAVPPAAARLTRVALRRAVDEAPYFMAQLMIPHGTLGRSTQVITIQTPYGVKVTPEQKPGASPRRPLELGTQ